jgi:hypothetical protein
MSCADVPSVTKHSIAVPCMIFMFCHMFQKRSSHLYAVSVPADSTVKPCCANMREFIFPEKRDLSIHVISVLRSKCLSVVLQNFIVALCWNKHMQTVKMRWYSTLVFHLRLVVHRNLKTRASLPSNI